MDVQNANVVVTVFLRLAQLFFTVTDLVVIGWPGRFSQRSQFVQTQAE